MEHILIRKIKDGEMIPWSLLELADPSIEKVKSYVKSGDLYVALIGDQVVGEYVISAPTGKVVEILNIAVNPIWQGKGIGKMLVLDAIQRVKHAGNIKIEIGTGNSSIKQIKLYKECGFEIVGVDVGFFLRNYLDPIYENGIRCEDMVRMAITF